MSEPTITIECRVCGEKLVTQRVDKAIAFDKEHRELHVPICSVCSRPYKITRQDGMISGHGNGTGSPCPGSGQPPVIRGRP